MFTPFAAAAALAVASLSGGVHAPVVRVYDARDLAAAMHGPGRAEGVDVVQPVVEELAASLEVMATRIAPGIYTLVGDEKRFDEWVRLTRQVFDAHADGYVVEVALLTAPAASPPAIGAEVRPESPVLRSRQSVPRRVEAPFNVTEERTYIARWQPVVAESSVGYEASTAAVTSGLVARVFVGAGDDAPAGVSIRIDGVLARADVIEVPITLSAASLTIGLPVVASRSFRGEAIVSDKPTVLAVVPGFEPGECLVVAAAVAPRKPR